MKRHARRLFKECPHPDDKQRLKLSQELGLKPRQVKFWFQNRRTQMKAQQDRADNVLLRAENESLKADNYRLQAAIRNVVCPTCGHAAVLAEMSFEEQQLRVENARLKDEVALHCSLPHCCCLNPRNPGRAKYSLFFICNFHCSFAWACSSTAWRAWRHGTAAGASRACRRPRWAAYRRRRRICSCRRSTST